MAMMTIRRLNSLFTVLLSYTDYIENVSSCDPMTLLSRWKAISPVQ